MHGDLRPWDRWCLFSLRKSPTRPSTPDDATEIVESLGKEPVQRLLLPPDLPFFTRQYKNVLALSGRIDPENIDDYLAAGGYSAVFTAINEMRPADIIRRIQESGLRGRGGAGYPTGLKWSTVAKAAGWQKIPDLQCRRGRPRRLHGPIRS